MSILTSSPAAAIDDERVRAVAQAVVRTFQLAAQKAALNHADPKRFPVQKGASAEGVIAPLFKEMPAPQQQIAKARALASVAAPVGAAAAGVAAGPRGAVAADDFDGVDFQSPVPVSEQLLAGAGKKAAPAASAPGVGRLRGGDDFELPRLVGGGDWPRRGDGEIWPPKEGDRGDRGGGSTLNLKRAVLALHSIKAVKDTGDWGKDEIYLGATAVGMTTVNGSPVASKEIVVDAFSLGSFKKGQTKQLNDKVLYAFSLPKPEQYPVGYVVTLLLVEKDYGKSETIRKVLKSIEDAVRKEIEKWVKKLPGLLRDLAQLVLKVLPPILAEVFNAIARWLGDDLFDPATISISMASPADRVPGNVTPRQTVPLLMKGGKNGRYELDLSWHVFA